MTTGMFWFDQEVSNSIQERICKAAVYFQQKFGILPTVCYLNPESSISDSCEPLNIEILYNHSIQPNHLWLGVKD